MKVELVEKLVKDWWGGLGVLEKQQRCGVGVKGFREAAISTSFFIFIFFKILHVILIRQKSHIAQHVACLCGQLTTT